MLTLFHKLRAPFHLLIVANWNVSYFWGYICNLSVVEAVVGSLQQFEDSNNIARYIDAIQDMGRDSDSTETLATKIVDYLYEQCKSDDDSQHCLLIRFFRTVSYRLLPQKLKKELGLSETIGGVVPRANSSYLTLLATRGKNQQWNNPAQSKDHRCISLVSENVVLQTPMIAQLIKQLGIKVSSVVDPVPVDFVKPSDKTYHALYIEDAHDNPNIPSQDDFVKKFGVRSVVGFGSLLPTGDMFSVVMFLDVAVNAQVAANIAKLAGAVEVAINEMRSGKKERANILIADVPKGAARIHRIMRKKHRLLFAHTLDNAREITSKVNVDLIICGAEFDESRMFDLLKLIKSDPAERPKPFVCFRHSTPERIKDRDRMLMLAATKLGASCYINAIGISDRELCYALESYLPESIWAS